MDLKTIAFFNGIDASVIKEVESHSSEKKYDSARVIFEKGDPADHLYFLKQGEIKLFLREKDQTIYTLRKPGEVFGWSAIVENGVYTSSAACKTASSVIRISRESIKDIFNRHPDSAVTFYQRIGNVFSQRLTTVIS